MKKILICILLFFPFSVFAENSVNLLLSQSQVELGEVFELQLSVTFDSTAEIPAVTIPGIEKFNVFSSSQWETLRQVNDDFERTWKLTLALEPKSTGEFTLGPVVISIDGEQYSSEEKILTVGTMQTELSEDTSENTPWESLPEGIKKTPFQIPYFTILLLVFIGVFYFLIHRFLLSQKSQQIPEPQKIQETLSYPSLLKELKSQIPTLSDKDFFSQLHHIVRLYIQNQEKYSYAMKATLAEITPHIKNSDMLRIFTDSYMKEFSGKKISQKEKETLVDSYIKLF